MLKPQQGLPVIQRNVAGIDIGSERHWVCAPAVEGEAREVCDFGATTSELKRMAQWLHERHVVSVAMESTGVYWIAPHEVLEAEGFQVLLTDTRRLARVPGHDKKSDPHDCQWLQRLHSCGLLAGCFRPPEQVCKLRTLVRDKGVLVAERSDWLRRMQKSLDQMNVRLHRALSDIDGVTGMAILRAIVNGERDAQKLAALRHPACRKTAEEVAEQLNGHWREDHLFSLRQALHMYDAIEARIADYDREILRVLETLTPEERRHVDAPPPASSQKKRTIKHRGQEPMRQLLFRVSGVDLTRIDGIGVEVLQVVLSEYGWDLNCFPTEKHFVSHLRLAPKVAKSGGKPLAKNKRNSASTRTAAGLRMAAVALRHSKTALGAYYRDTAKRLGADVAVFATARKLATLIYRAVRWGASYVDEGIEAYERRNEQLRFQRLTARAKQAGYQLTPLPA